MSTTPVGKRGLVVDRDGTLIDVVRDEETGTINTAFHPDQLRLLPGVIEGLTAARAAGFGLAIATNQPGPAKGHFSAAAVTRTNDALIALLAARGVTIDGIETCIHHPEGGEGGDASLVGPCDCRKPKPGMMKTIARKLGWDLARSWMVGDTATDVQSGVAAGMRTALVFPAGRCELCPLRGGPAIAPEVTAATFDAVVAELVKRS